MRVCYVVQSHGDAGQIDRLVGTLRELDPEGLVYLSHNRHGSDLLPGTRARRGVHVSLDEGGRGRFHNVRRWLDAVSWIRDNDEVDYVVTITGQDYPVRPSRELHQALSRSGDGMLEHFPVLRPGGPWSLREGRTRYLYRWFDLVKITPAQRDRLHVIHAFNHAQPLFRVNVAYGTLRVGIRWPSPVGERLECWGGSFFTNLSWRSARYVLEHCEDYPDVLRWGERSLLSEEAFIHTILLSARRFAFENTSGRYYDFSRTIYGSPADLGLDDVAPALASGAFFARKWVAPGADEAYDRIDAALAGWRAS